MSSAVADEILDDVVDEVINLVLDNPRATAEVSFGYFCYEYLRAHFNYGFGKFQQPIIKELEELAKNVHLLMLLPREHGKSTLITFAYVLWCICYRRKRHIIILSAVQDTAEKFLANIKAELQLNQRIIEDFGDLVGEPLSSEQKRPWRAKQIMTTNYVVVAASSTGGTIRGTLIRLPVTLDPIGIDARGKPIYEWALMRPDLMVADDIIDDKRVMTREVRERTWWWLWKNLFPALHMTDGNLIVVGTPLHDDDAISRLLADKIQTTGWHKIVMPAANPDKPFDADGNPIDCLFPEKWASKDYARPIKQVNQFTGLEETVYRSYLWWRHMELGLAFGPEFLLRPMNAATRWFNREDFGWYVVKSPAVDQRIFKACFETTGKMLEYLPADLIVVTTLDPAGTDERRAAKTGNDVDYTVVMTVGYSPSTRKFYLVAVNRMRCTPFIMLQTLLVHVQLFSRVHGARYVPDPSRPHEYTAGFPFYHLGVGIETVAFQAVLQPMLEEIAGALRMYPTVMTMDRGERKSKRLRAQLPSTLSQNKLLMFPFPVPGYADKMVMESIDELCSFPQPDQHDDVVDAFTDACHILYAYSLQLGRGLMGEEALRDMLNGSYGFRGAPTMRNIEEYIGGARPPAPAYAAPAA